MEPLAMFLTIIGLLISTPIAFKGQEKRDAQEKVPKGIYLLYILGIAAIYAGLTIL